VGRSPSAIAFGDGSVWVSVHPFIAGLDAETGRVTRSFGALGTAGLAFEDHTLWALRQPSSTAPGVVDLIDARTGDAAGHATVGVTPVGITVGGGAVWVANFHDSTITKIELAR